MLFWRLHDNKLGVIDEVPQLGWEKSEGIRIPDDYIEKGHFIIFRTCFGVGDWGIISGMPQALKEKYPHCKVYIPSAKLCERLFGSMRHQWGSWSNPFTTPEIIFKHNPFVDGLVDNFEDEIYHDHYRIYDKHEPNIPLVEQMLTFWGLESKEMENSYPKLYYSVEEFNFANAIIEEYAQMQPYITLLLSNRFDYSDEVSVRKIQEKIDGRPCFYWTSKPLKQTGIVVNPALDLRHINVRIQMLLRELAHLNVGNQCGVLDTIAPMAPTYTIPRGSLRENYIRQEHYL